MTASAIDRYAREVGDLPLLGHIVFTTVPERDYDRASMANWMTELGLTGLAVPAADTAWNAFRKACTAANERVRYEVPGTNNRAHILVRPMDADAEGQSQLLVREVRDPENRQLSFDTVGEARFYRPSVRGGRTQQGTERLRLTPHLSKLQPYEERDIRGVLARIDADYDRYRKFMTANKIRWFVRDYLRSLSGVPVKQSTWFVYEAHSEELGRLRELLLRLGCEMDRVPLLALAETKEMLNRAVVSDTIGEMEGVINDILELRNHRQKITGTAYAKVKARFTSAVALAGQFTAWLDTNLDTAQAALDMATAQLDRLQKDMMSGDAGSEA